MGLSLGRDVLLFFQDYDRDTFFKQDRRLRRIVRRAYQKLRQGRPRVTGFEVWFQLLKKGIERTGRRVHVNAHRLAAQNPDFPVGLCGYPHILSDWTLPNPAVVGPGLFDHPAQKPDLMKDPRYRVYITTCGWYHDMFAPVYGEDRCGHWHAGIDIDAWPNLANAPKDLDVLVYDKIRWDRDRYEAGLLTTIRERLNEKGLKFEFVRYGHYDHDGYKKLLTRSRSMLFLCEHETQGMAYQEALASGIPVLAWEPGTWVDPRAKDYDDRPIPASSVPFFDVRCGDRFRDAANFAPALERFFQSLSEYAPRDFVKSELSLAASGQAYVNHLAKAAAFGRQR